MVEAKQAAEGFTRCEQECKNPVDGVGWLALASARDCVASTL